MRTQPKPALDHVLLIDGSSFMFRGYHALPPLTRSDGCPIGAVLGFSNLLAELPGETDADGIAVVFDAARSSFRNRLYKQYKAQRPPLPEGLVPQLALVRQATDVFGICRIELVGFEADDLIATYARHAVEAGAKVTIVSSDKDFMQLVGDRVRMLDPIKNRPIGPAEVYQRFGVGPERVVDVQALCGDSADNVPGVPGIGVKTAAALINAYGDLETLLERAAEISRPMWRRALIEHATMARLYKKLVTLDNDVPPPRPLSALAVVPPDPEPLMAFLREMEFAALAKRMTERLSGRGAGPLFKPGAGYRQPTGAPRQPNYGRLFAEAAEQSLHDYLGAHRELLVPGYWAIKLRSGGPPVPARTFWCDHPPPGHLAGEIAGDVADPLAIFAARAREELRPRGGLNQAQEYAYQVANIRHARQWRPDEPIANPRHRVRLSRLPMPFSEDN